MSAPSKRSSAASFLALALIGWMALAGSSRAATLYIEFATGDSSEPKWTTGLDLVYGDRTVGAIAQSWLRTDPAAAAAYVASMPESSGRDSIMGSYLAVSMGGYGDQNDMLRRAIEASLSQGLNGSGIIGGGRGREGRPLAPGSSPGAVGMGNGTLVLGNDTNYGFWESADLSANTGWNLNWANPIPEPSVALLGGLGILGLLRRRR